MAKKDMITKEYMRDKQIFTDLFNFFLFGGEKQISPDNLQELDTTTLTMPFGTDNNTDFIQRYRDVLKSATIMHDEQAVYLLLGVENQSEVHNAMVVRNMLYDSLQYTMQVQDTAKSHKRNEDKPTSNTDYLSGFYSTDKLIPVITLTVYWGAEEWTAPRTLFDMFDERARRFTRFISDYRLNLIVPAELTDEELNKLHSELKLALLFIKYSKNKKRLSDIVEHGTEFHDVSRTTANLINVLTNTNLQYAEGEERVDMCQAIHEICEDYRTEGRLETYIELVRDNILTVEQAAARLHMSVDEFKERAEVN